jgi:prevent-host-death family protein
MKRVKIAELKDQLSRHIRAVERGAEIEVTDRQRPVARILPLPKDDAEVEITPARRSFSSARRRRYRPARWRRTSLELLREERQRR